MSELNDESVNLVVTSPPYPMIEMWDDIFSGQNPDVKGAFETNRPRLAFELMHRELDKVWSECWRVLKKGSFMCINIGDATRTINGEFSLYNNNTRVIQACEKLGFTNLPNILWRKATNSPNKFMGSGMLPCGAYVTLEHEWILIFRKGGKRDYSDAGEKKARRMSSFFWEERNIWFSDVWTINGVKQRIDNAPSRGRNASFPIEIPYRLINMFSQKGDLVLDPFMGLGTTAIAATICERNSAGFEIDLMLKPLLKQIVESIDLDLCNSIIHQRYQRHVDFIKERLGSGKEVKYDNPVIGCKVVTGQETELVFHYVKDIKLIECGDKLRFESSYFLNSTLSEMPSMAKGTLFSVI